MTTSVNDIANALLLVYAALFPIVYPIGGAPIFLGLTRHCTDNERDALALRVTSNSFFLLLGSMFVGSYVLEYCWWIRCDCNRLEPSPGRKSGRRRARRP
jgi:small neutral amino acid transporter SnatA (MarC family)